VRESGYGERTYQWIVNGFAVMLIGGLTGYMLAPKPSNSVARAAAATAAATPLVDEGALRAYRDILSGDPKNLQAAVNAGNLLYDAQRYVEAIPYYQQAVALNSSDINVSTDLGTALWYSGRADEALAQYAHSLSIDADHPQTLFNVGVVKADGKRDFAGAIAAWEQLLATHPEYPNAATARQRIADAKAQAR